MNNKIRKISHLNKNFNYKKANFEKKKNFILKSFWFFYYIFFVNKNLLIKINFEK